MSIVSTLALIAAAARELSRTHEFRRPQRAPVARRCSYFDVTMKADRSARCCTAGASFKESIPVNAERLGNHARLGNYQGDSAAHLGGTTIVHISDLPIELASLVHAAAMAREFRIRSAASKSPRTSDPRSLRISCTTLPPDVCSMITCSNRPLRRAFPEVILLHLLLAQGLYKTRCEKFLQRHGHGPRLDSADR